MKKLKDLFWWSIALSLFAPWGVGTAGAESFGIVSPKAGAQPRRECLSSPTGRFVFGQISGSSKDQFMLDTWTGRLWRISESGEIGKFLTPVPYRNEGGKCFPVPGKIPGRENTGRAK